MWRILLRFLLYYRAFEQLISPHLKRGGEGRGIGTPLELTATLVRRILFVMTVYTVHSIFI